MTRPAMPMSRREFICGSPSRRIAPAGGGANRPEVMPRHIGRVTHAPACANGYPDGMQENTWRSSTLAFVDSLLRDLRYSVWTLVRNPGFSLLAIFCLT